MPRFRGIPESVVVALGLCSAGPIAWGQQTYERETTITGPRGRTIQRQLKAERSPGSVNREIHIQRPAGSFDRQVTVQRQPGTVVRSRSAVVGRESYVPGPSRTFVERDVYVPGPTRTIVERDVVIERGPRFGPVVGVAAPFFGLSIGAPPPPPPPPVVVVPEPVYVEPAPPPVVVYNPPRRYQPAPPPEAVVVDPVADALGRLRSGHDNSRRDGALTLGRLGDARAVPALRDRLRDDDEKEVRMAAAWALGEIGDPTAAVGLQRAALYDKKQEVRATAERAYRRLPLETGPALDQPAAPGFQDRP
ncbi:MAG TPA: HEAT repeat domain-containing protein [Isosphaeraceae bacterium]